MRLRSHCARGVSAELDTARRDLGPAAGHLRARAGILGVGFQTVETPRAPAQAIEEHRAKSLILMGTSGYGPIDGEDAGDLARFPASRQDVAVRLVLSASMKSADLSRVVDRLESFRPGTLLFTRRDETGTFGPIGNEAARTGNPVSRLAPCRQIPGDLAPAAEDRSPVEARWVGTDQ